MTTKESDENQKSTLPAEKIEEKGHVPAKRPGSDEEMAQGVIFLAKNKYVNGEIIAIDGGVLLEVPGRWMRQSRVGLYYSICKFKGLEKFIIAAFVPVHCVVTLR